MQAKLASARWWLTALGIVILLAGLALAWVLRTQAVEAAASQYRIVDGQTYLQQAEDSKQGADATQRYGGTPAMIVAAYKRKLGNLLNQENLAWLLALLAVIAAGACFRAAWSDAARH